MSKIQPTAVSTYIIVDQRSLAKEPIPSCLRLVGVIRRPTACLYHCRHMILAKVTVAPLNVVSVYIGALNMTQPINSQDGERLYDACYRYCYGKKLAIIFTDCI